LGQARHTHQKRVSPSEQADRQALYGVVLADNDPSQLLPQPSICVSQLADRLDVIFAELFHDHSVLNRGSESSARVPTRSFPDARLFGFWSCDFHFMLWSEATACNRTHDCIEDASSSRDKQAVFVGITLTSHCGAGKCCGFVFPALRTPPSSGVPRE